MKFTRFRRITAGATLRSLPVTLLFQTAIARAPREGHDTRHTVERLLCRRTPAHPSARHSRDLFWRISVRAPCIFTYRRRLLTSGLCGKWLSGNNILRGYARLHARWASAFAAGLSMISRTGTGHRMCMNGAVIAGARPGAQESR